jgi:hypothetical protein
VLILNKNTKKWWKKNEKKNKNQMEEIKKESNVLRFNVIKFEVVSLNSISKCI